MSARISIFDHFKKLFDFAGREDRASFWPYAAVAFIITMVAGMFFFVPVMTSSLQAMQQFAAQHPEQATITSGPGQYSISIQGNHPEFIPARSIAYFLGVTFGLAILLYAAAVARRLHDRGKSGFWGLMPQPFIGYSSIQMPKIFASLGTGGQPDLTLFFSIFLSNLLYIVTLILLVILLSGPSDPASNRYSKAV
ncbi:MULTISPECIES: DUF805 domain-containing protein [unclassified Novosphingobium]|uniref:DUF805 domain-containing protein n=1 Tax=unclassified Novosphingobium TaxID=2644732 RepID=UPI00146C5BFA|nr:MULTISPECIES: DUF805 domain-containing protein [unclassified Novosphingobium]NMN03093.1 uncharacterized membrane protein YhaH (DUF805 family) [Novosphingobium sp. SG919]NMN86919.1 uncharacterized membrane protein YhaH (DUF805 family) [Novosphingobium sp. SG916]